MAELFGESDSDEEAALPSPEPQAASRKDRLEELAQKKRKEAVTTFLGTAENSLGTGPALFPPGMTKWLI